MMQRLIETITNDFTLSEGKEGGLRLRVPFMQADTVGLNGRRYPRDVLEQSIRKLKERIAHRSAFGSTSHPKGSLEVPAVSHLIEDAELAKDGTAFAVINVMPTTKGKDLITLLKAGARIGISARGFGETKTEDKVDVVQPGYELLGFDFCLDPSLPLYADKGNFILESAPLDTEPISKAPGLEEWSSSTTGLTEEEKENALRRGFNMAQAGGFKGSMEDYKLVRNADFMSKLRGFSERYARARNAGYKGTQDEFLDFETSGIKKD